MPTFLSPSYALLQFRRSGGSIEKPSIGMLAVIIYATSITVVLLSLPCSFGSPRKITAASMITIAKLLGNGGRRDLCWKTTFWQSGACLNQVINRSKLAHVTHNKKATAKGNRISPKRDILMNNTFWSQWTQFNIHLLVFQQTIVNNFQQHIITKFGAFNDVSYRCIWMNAEQSLM